MANIKREKRICVRVTEEELARLEAKAKKMGLRVTTYLRMMGLRDEKKD